MGLAALTACSVCCFACAVSWAAWLLFTGAPALSFALLVRCPGPLGSCSPVCPLGVLFCVCGVLGHLAPVHWCAHSVCCFACAVSWASWLLFTGVPARCVALLVRCPGPLGSCSPVCPLGVLCCACGVLGHLAPVQRCARSVRCLACAVSWATWLLFTCAPARCVVLRVRCPGPLGSRSPVRPLCPLLCSCGVLGHLAPVHRCARSVCCFARAVSWATWLLFTGVPARCVVLRVWCPGPLGSCSPVRPLGVLLRVCGVLGRLAPVHRCARSVLCFARAVSWATWLLFTGVPAQCVVLRVRCPGPRGSCSPVCPLGVLLCSCGVLGHLAPVLRCARSVCCVVRAVSWAPWLLFTGVPAQCVVLRTRCPGPLGSCSPVRPLGVLFCVCGVLGLVAPVHRCARSACCFARAVSWATWLLFTGLPARCVVLCLRCPGPLGSCSLVCPLGALCCVCGVLGHLAPVHLCARSCCFACAVSWAAWLPFTGAPALSSALLLRCPGPLGSCSPVCRLGRVKPGRGEPGPDRPPPSTPDGARDRGRTRRGARTTWNGPTSAQCWDRTRCARQPTQGGGGADAAGARAHTHAKGTRGLPEGQPDRARGTHRPRGMAYQRARVRDTWTGRPATRSAGHAGRDGGNGRDTTPGTGPSPPNRPRAPCTHGRGTAPAKAVVAHCATPQPLG